MDHERLFPWNLPKAVLVSGQSGFKASPTDQRYRLLKLSIIVFAFLYLALTLTSPLSAYFDSARPFSSLLFPVAGNSHNCRPMFPSIAGGSGVWLGRLWMLSSSGSLSAASKQRMLLPTSKALLHTWQTGGQESQYSYQQACVFEVGR